MLKEIEKRSAEIREEMKVEGADIKALISEAEDLIVRKAEYLAEQKAIETRKAEMKEVAEGRAKEVEKFEVKKEINMEEIRNSKEYIDAYAKYIKTEDDTECRALLTTENVSGSLPVPTFVYDTIKTAWENDEIMRRVRKASLRGNLKVSFEISSDGAVVHTEGGNAIDSENLVLGTVSIQPQSIKKLVEISDEAYDMNGEAFLRYIYDEIAYKISHKIADALIEKIIACGTVSTTTCPSVPAIKVASPGMGTIAKAMAELSPEARNPVVIINRKTWGTFKDAEYSGNFPADPFENLPVLYTAKLVADSVATTGVAYAIVGDLGAGALANFPDGDGITFKFDAISKADADKVRVIGREYVGLGVVADKCFVKITK